MEGLLLFTVFAMHTVCNIVKVYKDAGQEIQREFQEEIPQVEGNFSVDVLFILAGFALLALGSGLLVNKAVALAPSGWM